MFMFHAVYRKFVWSGLILLIILLIGSAGYWFIGGRQNSALDVLYMTVITITTIGFSEVIDLSGNPGGRLFTIFIAISGIGLMAYVATNLTALVVEGELTKSFRRRQMEKKVKNTQEHYIICGIGAVGIHIAGELAATGRSFVMVDTNQDTLEKALAQFPGSAVIEGDATDDGILLKSGVEKARGVFAVTGSDNDNLVISLSARQLNPALRVVVRCEETRNSEKMRKSGADAVISPTLIGGMRMASEMIRPTVVSFLDVMLRDREQNLRVEEVQVPAHFAGKTLASLNLKHHHSLLLLAVRRGENWDYNPPEDYVIPAGSRLIFMSNPRERAELEKVFRD